MQNDREFFDADPFKALLDDFINVCVHCRRYIVQNLNMNTSKLSTLKCIKEPTKRIEPFKLNDLTA